MDRMTRDIDELFIHYVGPYGGATCEDCYQEWLKSGHVDARGLRKYIVMLSREIPSAEKQVEFLEKAVKSIRP